MKKICIYWIVIFLGVYLSLGCDSEFPPEMATETQTILLSSEKQIVHEAELAKQPMLRLSPINQVAVVHLESDQLHPGDSATLGIDHIGYHTAEQQELTFSLESEEVAEARILDSQKHEIARLHSGLNTVTVPRGDFFLELTSRGTQETLLAVGNPNFAQDPPTKSAIRAAFVGAAPGIYITELPQFPLVSSATTATTLFIGASTNTLQGPRLVTSFQNFTSLFGNDETPLSLGLDQYFKNGGQVAYVLAVAEATPEELNSAWDSLGSIQFNILVLPDLSNLDPENADTVVVSALAVCQDKRAMLLVDLPSTILDVTQAVQWSQAHPNFQSAQLAAYWPPIKIGSAKQGSVWVGPAASMAGIYSQNDSSVGVWGQPAGAGLALAGISELATTLSLEDMASLESNTINPIISGTQVNVSDAGFLCWGARSFGRKNRPFISSTRLQNYIENSISQSIQWVVFEPANTTLFIALTSSISSFLNDLWLQGGLVGETANQAYAVVCDIANNPPETRELGEVYIEVKYAEEQPGQLVNLTILQKASAPDQ